MTIGAHSKFRAAGLTACLGIANGCGGDDGSGSGTESGEGTGSSSDSGSGSSTSGTSEGDASSSSGGSSSGSSSAGESGTGEGSGSASGGESTGGGEGTSSGGETTGGETGSTGGDSTGGDSTGGTGTTGDTEGVEGPPMVLETSPADGEVGVARDAVIVITFSEPMDQPSVKAAYMSDDLLAANATFSWNDIGDLLTITPNDPLPYAEGESPDDVDASTFTFSIAAWAPDLDGETLPGTTEVTFSTLRRIAVELPIDADLTGRVHSDGTINDSGLLVTGDYETGVGIRSFLSFDITSIPDGAELESAELESNLSLIQGTPHVDLACTEIAQVHYTSLVFATYDTPSLAAVGSLGTQPSTGTKSDDVMDALADDLANRAERQNRSQYRLRCLLATDGDDEHDYLTYQREDTLLRVSYLVP